MKLIRRRQALPQRFEGHPGIEGLLLEKNIGIGFGKLKLKLLVFSSTRALYRSWKAMTGRSLGKPLKGYSSLGAAHCLMTHCECFHNNGTSSVHIEVDPRYFAVIGLVKGYLSMEVICHESTHAGIYFSNRKSRQWVEEAKQSDDELICYPTGRIASAINRVLDKAGLYKE